VIFNQGNTAAADRNGIPAVTLSANNTSGIPVIGTTYALGVTLANTPGLRMRVFANTLRQILPTYNVLAEKTGTTTATSSWPARTSTRCSRDPASTTTARAAPPSSRPRSTWRS
jgi:hypothetical protein